MIKICAITAKIIIRRCEMKILEFIIPPLGIFIGVAVYHLFIK